MESPTSDRCLFGYTDINTFLRDVLHAKKQRNPSFSTRAWSRRLGFRNPSLLIDILKGRRKLKPELGYRIAEDLQLSQEEHAYYDVLVLLTSAKSTKERDFYNGLLKALRPDPQRSALKLSHFQLVADWYHFTLLETLSLKDFKNDPDYLCKRLRGRLTPEMIRLAIQRLKQLGLVKETESKLKRSEGNPVLKDEIPSIAVKNHHRQLLSKAREALFEQNIEQRDFRSTQLALKRENYDKAKKLIQDFHRAMQKLAEKEEKGEAIYAFNSQFFQLTREIDK